MFRRLITHLKFNQFKVANNRGAALIFSYLVLSVLFVLMAGFALSTASELGYANRYRDASASFWLAEAGINRFIQNTAMLDGGPVTVDFGTNSVTLSKLDETNLRTVTAVGNVNGLTRSVQIEFPPEPPDIYDNTMATGGNIRLIGLGAKLDVYGPTRITGTYQEIGLGVDGWFEDLQAGQPVADTTLTYPDLDGNSTPDEFSDFKLFNTNLIAQYPPSQVIHIVSDDTQVVIPNSSLVGVSVLYIEGSAPGTGNVDIYFDASWQDNQNITIITTGSVDYVQPLSTAADSQLNIIAWDGYEEASILFSAHEGVTYTHGLADFYSIFSYSVTKGNLIANGGIDANEALSWKEFRHGNPIENGNVPPGFEGLITTSIGGYASTPSSWKEI